MLSRKLIQTLNEQAFQEEPQTAGRSVRTRLRTTPNPPGRLKLGDRSRHGGAAEETLHVAGGRIHLRFLWVYSSSGLSARGEHSMTYGPSRSLQGTCVHMDHSSWKHFSSQPKSGASAQAHSQRKGQTVVSPATWPESAPAVKRPSAPLKTKRGA